MWNWIVAHGDKLFTFLTGVGTLITATGTANSLDLNAHAVAWITVATAVISLAHAIFITNDQQAAAKAELKGLPPVVKMLPLLALLPVLGLGGCALLQNPIVDATVQAAIDVGVGTWLAKNPAVAPLVVTEATALEQLASGNTASVATLEAQANALIAKSTLPVADKAAFQTLLALVAGPQGLLVTGAQSLPSSASVPLSMIFGDIANAAQLYTVAAGKSKTLVPVQGLH
jgi:hypothetical protein